MEIRLAALAFIPAFFATLHRDIDALFDARGIPSELHNPGTAYASAAAPGLHVRRDQESNGTDSLREDRLQLLDKPWHSPHASVGTYAVKRNTELFIRQRLLVRGNITWDASISLGTINDRFEANVPADSAAIIDMLLRIRSMLHETTRNPDSVFAMSETPPVADDFYIRY